MGVLGRSYGQHDSEYDPNNIRGGMSQTGFHTLSTHQHYSNHKDNSDYALYCVNIRTKV